MGSQDAIDIEKVDEIIDRHGARSKELIAILLDMQDAYRYLPEEALRRVASRLEIPVSQAFSLATFFRAFSLTPRGRHTICVCLGTACHVQGGALLIEKLERDLKVKRGGTTADLNFGLEEVHCLGCCGLAPVVTVDDDLYGKMTLTRLPGIVKKYTK